MECYFYIEYALFKAKLSEQNYEQLQLASIPLNRRAVFGSICDLWSCDTGCDLINLCFLFMCHRL